MLYSLDKISSKSGNKITISRYIYRKDHWDYYGQYKEGYSKIKICAKMIKKTMLIVVIPVVQILLVLLFYEWANEMYPLSKRDLPWSILIHFGARLYLVLVLIITVSNLLWKFNWRAILISIFLMVLFDSFFFDSMEDRPNRVVFIIALTNGAQLLSIFCSYFWYKSIISVKSIRTDNDT